MSLQDTLKIFLNKFRAMEVEVEETFFVGHPLIFFYLFKTSNETTLKGC